MQDADHEKLIGDSTTNGLLSVNPCSPIEGTTPKSVSAEASSCSVVILIIWVYIKIGLDS